MATSDVGFLIIVCLMQFIWIRDFSNHLETSCTCREMYHVRTERSPIQRVAGSSRVNEKPVVCNITSSDFINSMKWSQLLNLLQFVVSQTEIMTESYWRIHLNRHTTNRICFSVLFAISMQWYFTLKCKDIDQLSFLSGYADLEATSAFSLNDIMK